MTDDDPISIYLRKVESSLRVPRRQRQRVLEEIESHLQDGAAEHMCGGTPRSAAIAQVIEELGPPEAVGTAFTDGSAASNNTGAWRWLPILLPLGLLMSTTGLLVWRSLAWIPGGLTVGERTVLWHDVRSMAIAVLVTWAAWFSIRRADRDRAWQWAAWACAIGVVVTSLLHW